MNPSLHKRENLNNLSLYIHTCWIEMFHNLVFETFMFASQNDMNGIFPKNTNVAPEAWAALSVPH